MSNGGTVVIGAGPAGLATAAELRRRGVAALVLERADAVGSSWRGHYDRLRLNTSRWFSKLPGGSYGPGTGVFPTRDEVVSYLEDYANDNALDVRLRT
ncbi:MAG: FAD-dependent oxidoreductase, partial [Solirubrobacteraceae bacterium]